MLHEGVTKYESMGLACVRSSSAAECEVPVYPIKCVLFSNNERNCEVQIELSIVDAHTSPRIMILHS